MFCFIVGCHPEEPGALAQFFKLLQDVAEYDGLKEIMMQPGVIHKALLCFETKEQAQTAQWSLEMGGAEGREGNGQDADAGGRGGDPGLQGYVYSQTDYADDDSYGESAAGDGEGAGRVDQ